MGLNFIIPRETYYSFCCTYFWVSLCVLLCC